MEKWEDKRIKVIYNKENKGFAGGNNIGMQYATGDYIMLLNNDTVVTRGWLTNMVKHLQKNPGYGMCGAVTNSIGNEAKICVSYNNYKELMEFAFAYTQKHMGELPFQLLQPHYNRELKLLFYPSLTSLKRNIHFFIAVPIYTFPIFAHFPLYIPFFFKQFLILLEYFIVVPFIQFFGNVIRRMFREIDAECYIMVDGDDTYPAECAKELCARVLENGADMVVGDRLSSTYFMENKRPFHNMGNSLVRKSINLLFKSDIKDIMTGYRAFSYNFVKTFPVLSQGFEIETEMSIHAIDKNMQIENVIIEYRDRPEGSQY